MRVSKDSKEGRRTLPGLQCYTSPSPTWQDLNPRAQTPRAHGQALEIMCLKQPCTALRCQQDKAPSKPLHGRQPLHYSVTFSSPTPWYSSSASYHSCQQLIQERAKAPAVSCFGGLHDPSHFCRKSQRGIRAGGREHHQPYHAVHISLPAEAPSPLVSGTGQRTGEGRGHIPYLGHCTSLPVPGCSSGAPPLSTGQRK